VCFFWNTKETVLESHGYHNDVLKMRFILEEFFQDREGFLFLGFKHALTISLTSGN